MSTLLLSVMVREVYWSGVLLCVAIMGLILLWDMEQRYWRDAVPPNLSSLSFDIVRVVFTDVNGDDLETHSVPIGDDVDAYAVAMMHRYPKFRDYYIVV